MALGIVKKLAKGLSRTRENLRTSLSSVLSGPAELDEGTLDDLEAALLTADLGPRLTDEVMAAVKAEKSQTGSGPREAVRAVLRAAFPDVPVPASAVAARPHVIFVVGVNGGGKTTTVGKLAARDKQLGREVMVVAADTFRAAAIDQLERWSERANVQLVKQQERSDPAAVVFDALSASKARSIDTVIVDTAGRLHTKLNLMAELEKLARVAGRVIEDAPHEVLLVVDATTGQNGMSQAKEFTQSAELTGVVLTKLDGTAKGGVALAIHRELGVPIRYVGVGEAIDDLLEFDPEAFIDGLLGAES